MKKANTAITKIVLDSPPRPKELEGHEMSRLAKRQKRTQEHVNLYERWESDQENWKQDHDIAMLFFDFQEWLAEGVHLFRYLEKLLDGYRYFRYSRAEISFPMQDIEISQAQSDFTKWFEHWHDTALSGVSFIADFRSYFGNVSQSEEFESLINRIPEIKDKIRNINTALSPALHLWDMTEEEYQQIQSSRSAIDKVKFQKSKLALGKASLVS